jgi:hypothetical protein
VSRESRQQHKYERFKAKHDLTVKRDQERRARELRAEKVKAAAKKTKELRRGVKIVDRIEKGRAKNRGKQIRIGRRK